MKKVIKKLLDVLCVGLILGLIFFVFSSFKAKRNPEYIPKFLGYRPMIVLSGSMSPAIEAGDMIVTKPIQKQNLCKGDIITFRTMDDILVTHRIIEEKDDGSFITKGDANNDEDIDLRVHEGNIVGKYLFRIPKGGYIIKFIQSPIGIIMFILIPIIILVWGEISQSVKKDSKNI